MILNERKEAFLECKIINLIDVNLTSEKTSFIDYAIVLFVFLMFVTV